MVSRSEFTLAFGEMEQRFTELTQVLNDRTTQLQTKFSEVDLGLNKHEQMLMVLDNTMTARFTSIEEALKETIEKNKEANTKLEFLNQKSIVMDTNLDEVNDQYRTLEENLGNHHITVATEMTGAMRNVDALIAEARRVEDVLKEADRCFHNLNGRIAKFENDGGAKGREPAGRGGLVDPKLITVPKYSGPNHKEFIDWRDLIDEMTNTYFPGAMEILTVTRKLKTAITENVFNDIKSQVEMRLGQSLKWSYHQLKHDLGVYMLTKLGDNSKAKLTAEGAPDKNGVEMHRLLHQRYDKVTADAEAMMTSEITRMGAHQAKNLEDLRDKLAVLQAKVADYRKRLGKEPTEELLGSVLTTILDPQTRREFVHITGILGDYEAMKDKITALADGSSSAMDIGLVDHDAERLRDGPGYGAPTTSPELSEVKRPANPNIQCWHCNEKGHISRDCPSKDKPPAGGKSAGAWGKGQSKGGSKGGWPNKGYGKGSKGKGKGGKGKGMYGLENAEQDWWGDEWFGGGHDSELRQCGSLEKAVPLYSFERMCAAFDGQCQCEGCESDNEEIEDDEFLPENYASLEEYPELTGSDPQRKDDEIVKPRAEDLEGWKVKVSKSKKLRPLKKQKVRTAPPQESVEWLNSQPHLMRPDLESASEFIQGRIDWMKKQDHLVSPEAQEAREWIKGRAAIEALLAKSPPGQVLMQTKPLSKAKRLDILERAKAELNEVEKLKDGWEPIEMTVDSGAGDTVCPIEAMERIVADLQNASEDGFVVADGTKIPNKGCKEGVIATQEWSLPKGVSFQVAPVHKTLLSVSRMVEIGHRVVFDKDWSYIEDVETGERTTLIERNGLYILRAWVRPRKKSNPEAPMSPDKHSEKSGNEPGFHRQGR